MNTEFCDKIDQVFGNYTIPIIILVIVILLIIWNKETLVNMPDKSNMIFGVIPRPKLPVAT